MNESNDLRTKRTRRWLQDALRELMKKKPYQKIKIGEIAYQAEVARPTFYLHYTSKDGLLLSVFDDVFLEFRESMQKELLQENVDPPLFGKMIFNCIRKNSTDLLTLLDAGVESMVEKRFKEIIVETCLPIREIEPIKPEAQVLTPYMEDLLASAVFALLKRWVQEGMVIPDETLGLMVANMLKGLREMVRQ